MRAILTLTILTCLLGAQSRSRGKDPLDSIPIPKLVAALDLPNHQTTVKLRDILRKLGARAVPDLHEALRDSSKFAATQGEREAARVLGMIGAPAKNSIPTMLALLPHEDDSMESALIQSLGKLSRHSPDDGAAIRTAMLEVIYCSENMPAIGGDHWAAFNMTRPFAVRTWSRTLLSGERTAEQLVAALKHENCYVREFAIERLGARKQATKGVVEGLLAAHKGPHPSKIRCPAEGAEVGGIEFALDYDRRLRHAAAIALVAVAAEDPRSVPAHIYLLGRPGPETRRRSVLALGRIGEAAQPAIDTMLRLLGEDVPEVRREVATAIGMLGVATPAVRAALERAAKDGDPKLSRRAAATLRLLSR